MVGPSSYSFERVAACFEELRQMSSADRVTRLNELAEHEPRLHVEVQELLRHHTDDSGVLSDPEACFDLGPLMESLDDEPPMPDAIGAYRPVEVLGRGGMGTVYRAERSDGSFSQQVAIKVLRADLMDPELVRRFRTERRILAGLRHPNITALLDGGTTEDGRPYVVMEHIEGSDLVTHCREAGLPLRQRLELFVTVCRAVEYAHRNLVVHRDLKPNNILVTSDGQPKLLDFGIAKLLAPDSSEHSVAITGAGMMLLTPEYASPEQVRGEPITTATDVYALGAILFEVLTGTRAQVVDQRTPTALNAVVCDQPTSAPSTILGDSRTARQLVGDLDNIVLTALRKEPERRYGSASDLAADLQRHLDGLPVNARPDTWSYRTTKFLRRHRVAVSAGALFVIVLGASAVSLAMLASDLRIQRDRAVRESTVSREVTDFMVTLFELAEPDGERADQVTARDLLSRGSSRIAHELDTGPQIRASLMEAMGRAYIELGLYDDAEAQLGEAMDLLNQGDPEASGRATVLHWLGAVRHYQGRDQEAQPLIREALALVEAGVELPPAAEIGMLASIANSYRQTGQFEDALHHISKALELADDAFGPDHDQIAALLLIESTIEIDRANYDAAERAIDRALAIRTKTLGLDHPKMAPALRQRADLYRFTEREELAIADLERALQIDRDTLGDDHPDVDTDLFYLAATHSRYGNLEHSADLFREVLARDREHLGDHPHVALDMGQLASVLGHMGQFAEAESLFREAIALQERVLPPDHPERATTLSNFGTMFHNSGRTDLAIPYFRQALEQRARLLPPDHPTVLTSRTQVALGYYAQRDFARAEEEYRAILDVRRQRGETREVGGSVYSVGMAVAQQGRSQEAIGLLEESLAIYQRTTPADHYERAMPMHHLGRLHLEAGRIDEAIDSLERAYEIRRAAFGTNAASTASTGLGLGSALLAARRLDEAEPVLLAALETYLETFGEEHPSVASARDLLVKMYELMGRPADASRYRGS